MSAGTAYESPLRRQQAAATRARILESCAALVEAGSELTYAAVAGHAGVQERTVYRHFPTKADLEDGLWQWIVERYTQADFSAATVDQLIASMRRSFAGFDAGAPLIRSMLRMRQGQEIRLRRQSERRSMFERCAAEAAPKLGPADRRRFAAAMQVLYSAPAWELLRSFWDMSAVESAAVVEFAIRAMVNGLQDPSSTEESHGRNSRR